MTKKADFNAEEWSTLVEGPVVAGMRVATAGRGGTFRESMAMGKVYTHARQQHGENELLDEIVSSPPSVDADRIGSPDEIAQMTTERLREAMGILQAKAAPEDADAYRTFVLAVARAAAGAHKEGGFLGIGGQEISETEQAALDEISAALA